MDKQKYPIEFDGIEFDGEEAYLLKNGEIVDTIYLEQLVNNFIDDMIKLKNLYKRV